MHLQRASIRGFEFRFLAQSCVAVLAESFWQPSDDPLASSFLILPKLHRGLIQNPTAPNRATS